MRAAPPIQLTLRASRLERAWLIGLHLLALAMPWLAELDTLWRSALTLTVIVSACWQLRRYHHLAELGQLRLLPDGAWQLVRAGSDSEVRQVGDGYLSPWLMLLPLQFADGRRLRLVLWPDSADPTQLRHLRAWLRWRRPDALADG